MVGGMVTAMILSLLVIPVLFRFWKEADLRRNPLDGVSGLDPSQAKETSPSAMFKP
jgi:Cu(I)/Ag(I) efflux system membrane protein CusA/SilA